MCFSLLLKGDPSIFGNLDPHPAVKEALKDALDSGDVNISGYPHSAGLVEARSAVAEVSSTNSCQVTHEVSSIDCVACGYIQY